ncbi:MAG: chemotaxis protein CheX [bacterium]|nr:chemotaxis protein CheX [bacterium]
MENKDIDLTLVNPFLSAAYDVFKQIFNCELRKGQITIKQEPLAAYEIAILIGITGDMYTGVVIYSMKKYSAVKIAQSLDPNAHITEGNESFADALGELANIISGNAMSEFAKNGVNLTITTPSLIKGEAFEIHLLKQTTLCAEMISPFGVLEINVAIKKF